MKRIIKILITAALVTCLCVACKAADDGKSTKDESKKTNKLSIVTTIFPEYDWVKNILGDNPGGAQITMLLDNGVDLHSYQPTANDIMKISKCDVFIYVGGESDEWVEDALKEAVNKDMKVINLMDVLKDKVVEEELVEGMQEENHDHEDEEETEYDEHVWLSLKNTAIICQEIADTLGESDSANSDTYEKNATSYIEEINDLDKKYAQAVAAAKTNTLLFGDRFPFRYMTDDYALKYYAAFVGCSAETEASFETVSFLAKKMDELSLNAVMTIEGKEHRIAETIIKNTKNKNQKILTLDSLQSTTSEDAKKGVTYLGVMEKNLEVLKEALMTR